MKEPTDKIEKLRLLKADFHLHTADDPLDSIRYTAKELISKAADQAFDVMAITNHHRVTFNRDLFHYAQERNILLIPGIEMTIERRHVLVLNPPPERSCSDFSSLAKIRRPETLIIAPHPYFPGTYSLNGHLSKHWNLFDALEYCHFYLPMINFNQRAIEVSRSVKFPLIGNSDAHFLRQLGTTFSLIYAEKNLESIFAAIRGNKVGVVTRPLKPLEMGTIAHRFLGMKVRSKILKTLRRTRRDKKLI